MKFEIKHRYNNEVLFSVETDTWKLAVEAAIKSKANLRSANLSFADLRSANLSSANLSSADLSSANLSSAKNLPQSYINFASRDILFVLMHLKKEVPFLREKLVKGEVDGSQYQGDCACLIGSLANADGGLDKVCSSIPFYRMGTENAGEAWFLNIKKGDTPETNPFAAHAVALCDLVINDKLNEWALLPYPFEAVEKPIE